MSEKGRESGRKWDGVSRISNDQYKKNWNEIFGKKKNQEEVEVFCTFAANHINLSSRQ